MNVINFLENIFKSKKQREYEIWKANIFNTANEFWYECENRGNVDETIK